MWAFGTSRDGLGLTPERLWSLTRREYAALRKVYDDSHRTGDAETSTAPGVSNVQSTDEKKARLRGMFLAAVGGKRRAE